MSDDSDSEVVCLSPPPREVVDLTESPPGPEAASPRHFRAKRQPTPTTFRGNAAQPQFDGALDDDIAVSPTKKLRERPAGDAAERSDVDAELAEKLLSHLRELAISRPGDSLTESELARVVFKPRSAVAVALRSLEATSALRREALFSAGAARWLVPPPKAEAGPSKLAGAPASVVAAVKVDPTSDLPTHSARLARRSALKSNAFPRPPPKLAMVPGGGTGQSVFLGGAGGYIATFVEGLSPAPAQLQVMSAAAEALLGRRHGWLESPTGTGKTLALLTAVLSFQADVAAKKLAVPPVIFFVSRTKNQLDSVARELRRTPYRPLTTLLAGRDALCLHPPALRHGADKAAECEKAMFRSEIRAGRGCMFVQRAETVNYPESSMAVFEPGGELECASIEDLVRHGKRSGICPYHGSRDLLPLGACFVLLTYNQCVLAHPKQNTL